MDEAPANFGSVTASAWASGANFAWEQARAALAAQAPQDCREQIGESERQDVLSLTDAPQQAKGVAADERKRVIELAKHVGLIGWVSEGHEYFSFSDEQHMASKLVELIRAAAPQAAPAPAPQALTDEQIDDLRCRYTDKLESREDIRALVNAAIERAHGIGTKGGKP